MTRGRIGRALAVLALTLTASTPASVQAGETALLGNEGTSRIQGSCAENEYIRGIRFGFSGGRLVNVRAFCSDASGVDRRSFRFFFLGYEDIGGESTCGRFDLSTGLHGRSGDIIDAMGISCRGGDGALLGGPGGSPQRVPCPDGEVLSGLYATGLLYGDYPATSGMKGLCTHVVYVDTVLVAESFRSATLAAGGPRVAATLTRADTGAPLAGETLSFSSGGGALCSATTGADGRAACTPQTLAMPSVLTSGQYRVEFPGTAVMRPSSATGAA